MPLSIEEKIGEVVEYLHRANDILVITGAGCSADSGLPTYRGFGGIYDNRLTEDGMPIESALSGPMFQSRPEITWKYLAEIEQGARGASPNPAHKTLALMEQKFERFWILTQNVDGFHSAAGSKNVIEIHGNMYRLNCTSCDYQKTYTDYSHIKIPPQCPRCEAMLRPNIVLFEESLPEKQINTLYRETQIPFDLVFSIGTSSYFPYISEPIWRAKQAHIPTVEINPSETAVSHLVDTKIELGAADCLTEIWTQYQSQH
ncbi:NAD-dependent protein deacylase [bacterium]|nr:NAD-dependent protein deacylase [Mariniblastus sp.]MDB2318313.1 NAD-dependent protein deacylase [bacterium]